MKKTDGFCGITEEKKTILEETAIEVSDIELELATGGVGKLSPPIQLADIYCPAGHIVRNINALVPWYLCPVCKRKYNMMS